MIIQFKFGIFRGAESPFFGDINCKEDLLLHKRSLCFSTAFSMAEDIMISPGITGAVGLWCQQGQLRWGVSQKRSCRSLVVGAGWSPLLSILHLSSPVSFRSNLLLRACVWLQTSQVGFSLSSVGNSVFCTYHLSGYARRPCQQPYFSAWFIASLTFVTSWYIWFVSAHTL